MPRLLVLVSLLLATPALATPLRSGPVQVDDKGHVSVKGARVGKLPLPPPPRALSQSVKTVAGNRVLHLRVTGKGDRAAEMALLDGQQRVLFVGSTGPQGVDGEWSRHLRVDESGLLLYQRRQGVSRCDGAPVYLFPRMYDFAAGRFRPVAPVPRIEKPTELIARRGQPGVPSGPPLNTFRLTAASTQPGDEGAAQNLAPPSDAEDGKPETAWAEALGGAGVGEFLTAQSEPSPYPLRALSIIPGDAADAKAFRRANRLKSVLLLLSPTARYRVRFPADPLRTPGKPADPFWVVLPEPVATECATLVIESVYPGELARVGKGQGRTAISELRFFTGLEFGGGLEQVARDLADPNRGRGEAAVAILGRIGADGVRIVEEALRGKPSAAVRGRALRVLTKIGTGAAAGPLCALLPALNRPGREEALDALIRIGGDAVAPLVPLLDASEDTLAGGAARALGRIGGVGARDALLARIGKGTPSRRKEIAAGLVHLRGADDLGAVLRAAEEAPDDLRRADLVFVAGHLGRQHPARGDAARRIASLWPERDSAFELRYRILAAVGRLDPTRQLPLLRRALKSSEPVLRWLAAEQLRKVGSTSVTRLLVELLDDGDPRVRAAAAQALSGRGRSRTIGLSLAKRLKRERWTLVARTLAEALGTQCLAEGLAALRERLVAGPRGVDVRALISIAQCAPTGLDRELIAMAGKATWRTALRQRALDLLTPRMARDNTDELVRLLVELRRRAIKSEDEEALAVSATKVLASTGKAQAGEALADALALDPHEAIRAAAAAGLGTLCQRATAETLRRANKDASGIVRRTARRAMGRCRF